MSGRFWAPADTCEVALSHQAWRLRTIRQLINRHGQITGDQQAFPDFLDEHPIIRNLADYSQFVHDAFVQPSSNSKETA